MDCRILQKDAFFNSNRCVFQILLVPEYDPVSIHNELAPEYFSLARAAAVPLARPAARLRAAGLLQLFLQALAAGS